MLRATNAKVAWDPSKKRWQVQIHFGLEVIKRALQKVEQNASEDVLRNGAIQTAKDEGYDLQAEQVVIESSVPTS